MIWEEGERLKNIPCSYMHLDKALGVGGNCKIGGMGGEVKVLEFRGIWAG